MASIDARENDELAVIAEIKRHSPSVGPLDHDLSPSGLARKYQEGGASCISVLTDGPRFHGSLDDLRAARSNVDLPVLRKDFITTQHDVYWSRILEADAILLIAADLEADLLEELHRHADVIGLDVVVEVHGEEEMEAVLSVFTPDAIGVNQRDLATMELDHTVHERLIGMIPSGTLAIAESGVKGPRDAQRLVDLGYDAILTGTHLVTAENPAEAVYDLRRRPSHS